MLHYCKKCGRVLSHPNGENCSFCKSILYPVPEKYWLDGLDFLISNESKALLREELVKTSPEFDQYLFDHRDEILAKQSAEFDAKMAHGKAVLEEASMVPKCPYCQSTNISKIGTLNRMASVGLFGLASSKIGKTHKCNSCGSTW
jgi:hypothetical protein